VTDHDKDCDKGMVIVKRPERIKPFSHGYIGSDYSKLF
jgi:hypothetical protein